MTQFVHSVRSAFRIRRNTVPLPRAGLGVTAALALLCLLATVGGAFADRIKFSSMLWFKGLWSLVVYAPICHWV